MREVSLAEVDAVIAELSSVTQDVGDARRTLKSAEAHYRHLMEQSSGAEGQGGPKESEIEAAREAVEQKERVLRDHIGKLREEIADGEELAEGIEQSIGVLESQAQSTESLVRTAARAPAVQLRGSIAEHEHSLVDLEDAITLAREALSDAREGLASARSVRTRAERPTSRSDSSLSTPSFVPASGKSDPVRVDSELGLGGRHYLRFDSGQGGRLKVYSHTSRWLGLIPVDHSVEVSLESERDLEKLHRGLTDASVSGRSSVLLDDGTLSHFEKTEGGGCSIRSGGDSGLVGKWSEEEVQDLRGGLEAALSEAGWTDVPRQSPKGGGADSRVRPNLSGSAYAAPDYGGSYATQSDYALPRSGTFYGGTSPSSVRRVDDRGWIYDSLGRQTDFREGALGIEDAMGRPTGEYITLFGEVRKREPLYMTDYASGERAPLPEAPLQPPSYLDRIAPTMKTIDYQTGLPAPAAPAGMSSAPGGMSFGPGGGY